MAVLCLGTPLASTAQEPAPAPVPAPVVSNPTPVSLEQRVADLEAIVTNSAPGKGGPLSATAAPSHNAWIMVSAGLVLFMTLPGLALFYGGLVRRKNVLSILAQCLGLTAIITVLWWAIGYSLTFGKGSWFGGTEFAFSKV